MNWSTLRPLSGILVITPQGFPSRWCFNFYMNWNITLHVPTKAFAPEIKECFRSSVWSTKIHINIDLFDQQTEFHTPKYGVTPFDKQLRFNTLGLRLPTSSPLHLKILFHMPTQGHSSVSFTINILNVYFLNVNYYLFYKKTKISTLSPRTLTQIQDKNFWKIIILSYKNSYFTAYWNFEISFCLFMEVNLSKLQTSINLFRIEWTYLDVSTSIYLFKEVSAWFPYFSLTDISFLEWGVFFPRNRTIKTETCKDADSITLIRSCFLQFFMKWIFFEREIFELVKNTKELQSWRFAPHRKKVPELLRPMKKSLK